MLLMIHVFWDMMLCLGRVFSDFWKMPDPPKRPDPLIRPRRLHSSIIHVRVISKTDRLTLNNLYITLDGVKYEENTLLGSTLPK